MIYSYDRSQQDVPLLNFILIYNSTCFGQTYYPSTGDLILYSQQLVSVILFMLIVCFEYSIKTPDDGQHVCPKHVEMYIKIKLRNNTPCWLLSYEYCNLLSVRSHSVLSHPQRIIQNATMQ